MHSRPNSSASASSSLDNAKSFTCSITLENPKGLFVETAAVRAALALPPNAAGNSWRLAALCNPRGLIAPRRPRAYSPRQPPLALGPPSPAQRVSDAKTFTKQWNPGPSLVPYRPGFLILRP